MKFPRKFFRFFSFPKKMIRYIFRLLFLFPFVVSAQNPVPNPGFESWTLTDPDHWLSNNTLPLFATIESTSDAHSGSFAARASVVDLSGSMISPFLSAENPNGTGFPIQIAYTTFQCWYKADLAGSDAFIVTVVMYNDSAQAIGSADIAITTSTSSYTLLTLPIDYPSGTNVASCIIQFIAADVTGMQTAHLGTTFMVDDVELTGINSILTSAVHPSISVFPNPCKNEITIKSDFLSHSKMRVNLLNQNGELVYQENVTEFGKLTHQFPIALPVLPGGIYFIKLETEDFLYTKRIVVLRD